MAVPRPAEVTARYSVDRKLVFLSSAAHAFELRLTTQGARALFMALGRLFFGIPKGDMKVSCEPLRNQEIV